MNFEIRFKGLLAFVNKAEWKPNRHVVALMAHDDHVPLLTVHKDYLEDTTEVPIEAGDLRCFDLSGRVISSLGSGVPGGRIVDVPSTSLGFPTGVTPNASAHRGQPDANRFFAVFELPVTGELNVLGYYRNNGSFNSAPSIPIPESLIYTATVNASVTFYIGDLIHTVVVRGDSSVSITNLDPNVAGHHYHGFGVLFDEPDTFKYEPARTADPSGKPQYPVPNCTTGQDLDVDCSPVRFP